MVQDPRLARWPILLAVAFLAGLVFVVFFPVLGFEFADMDTPEQVINNVHVRGLNPKNLKHIFTSKCTESYYPVRMLTYAIDHQLWGGLRPEGFRLTNVLIHLANALLVFWLALRLLGAAAPARASPTAWWDVFAAAFSAGIFAVHPVVVEPVSWVPGREELLMTLGALGCIHCHVTGRRLSESGGRARAVLACHAGAAGCCAIACLSNAVGAVIPLLVTAWDVLTLGRRKLRKIVSGTSSLWLIGLATIVIKKSGYSAATQELPGVLSRWWAATVLNVYWLNLKTLFWPTELAIHYDWPPSETFLDRGDLLGGLAIGVSLLLFGLTCLAVWKLGRGKLVLLGLVWFALALLPTSQILPHHIVRADRFLYLPLVGLAVAMAIGLRPLGNALKHGPVTAATIVAAVAGLALLGILSARQVQAWQSRVSIWEDCLRVDPNNAFAHNNLARNLADRGDSRRALFHFQTALRIAPDFAAGLSDFARALAKFEDRRLRDYQRAVRLAERACALSEWKDHRIRRSLSIVHCDFANDLAARGEFIEARRHYDRAIEVDPDYDVPLISLALLLATCEDEKLREPELAVRLAERACGLLEAPDAHRLLILAAAYAEARRFEEAAATAKKAIPLAREAGDWEMAEDLQRRYEHYRSQIPRGSSGD